MFYIRSLRTGWTSDIDQVKLIPPGKETATEITLPLGGDNPMRILGQTQRTGWTATTPFNSMTFVFRSCARYQPAIPADVLLQSLVGLTAINHHGFYYDRTMAAALMRGFAGTSDPHRKRR